MRFTLGLTKKERRVIREIMDLQIESLNRLLYHDSEIDVTMALIERETDQNEFKQKLEDKLWAYSYLKEYPERILAQEFDLSIFTHILINEFPKTDEGRAGIWTKILIAENFSHNEN